MGSCCIEFNVDTSVDLAPYIANKKLEEALRLSQNYGVLHYVCGRRLDVGKEKLVYVARYLRLEAPDTAEHPQMYAIHVVAGNDNGTITTSWGPTYTDLRFWKPDALKACLQHLCEEGFGMLPTFSLYGEFPCLISRLDGP